MSITININEALQAAVARLDAAETALAQFKKVDALSSVQQHGTEEILQSILLGGHRNTFGAIPGIAERRAAVLNARLAVDIGDDAVEIRTMELRSAIRDAIQNKDNSRLNVETELTRAEEAIKDALAAAAHAVLMRGEVVDTDGIDGLVIRRFALALVAEANWLEPTYDVVSNFHAQMKHQTTLRNCLQQLYPDGHMQGWISQEVLRKDLPNA